MRYALLICQDEDAAISPEEQSAGITAFNVFADQMLVRGVLKDRGLRLQPSRTATKVQVRDGDVVIADGPFAETKEQIGGLYVVECEDLDEAIEVASKIPGAMYGTIEVRPVWEM
jgi:hypothetical protein